MFNIFCGEEMDNIESNLSIYLNQIQEKLEVDELVKLSFGDLATHIPIYNGEYVLDKESIAYLSSHFEKHFLDSEPRIRKGYIKHEIGSPIFLYKCDGSFEHDSNSYRHAFLMVRVAVIMSIIDGVIDNQELLQIRRMIWAMDYLPVTAKISLYAKANYFMTETSDLDSQEREYKRMVVNRSKIVERIPDLSEATAKSLLKVAKDIAVADGFLDREELTFLQDIYRALGLSARGTKSDLIKHATNKHITIEDLSTNKFIPEVELDDFDNVLGDLLFDYDDF